MERSGREARVSFCIRERTEQAQNWLKTWGDGQGLREWANQGGKQTEAGASVGCKPEAHQSSAQERVLPNSSSPRAWVHNLIFLSPHVLIFLREALSHLQLQGTPQVLLWGACASCCQVPVISILSCQAHQRQGLYATVFQA